MKTKATQIKNIIAMILGTLLVSAAYGMFFIPHNIAPGGVGGISVILSKFVPLKVGTLTLLLNIPIFAFAFKVLGIKFVGKTLALIILMTTGMDIISLNAVPSDRFLAAVCGGMLTGIGIGFVIYSGASTGGTDTLAVVLNKKAPQMSTSGILLLLDIAVVALSATAYGLETAIYSVIAVILQMVLIDYVFDGIKSAVAVYIISSKPIEIKQSLFKNLDRGVTDIKIKGGFTDKENIMLLCIVPKRQLADVKACVKAVDPDSFMFESQTKCVTGNGFEKF